jgi:ribosomal-protein-alanine N-acetyltransferase
MYSAPCRSENCHLSGKMIHEYVGLPLESSRLTYRMLMEEDCKPFEAFFVDNSMLAYVGVVDSKDVTPEQHSVAWTTRQMKRVQETGIGMLAVVEKASGKMIGNVGLIFREGIGPEKEDLFEIGYGFVPSRWGKGYATEAATRIREYFEHHSLDDKVVCCMSSENLPSCRVAEKLGMTRHFTFDNPGPSHMYRRDYPQVQKNEQ